MKINSQRLMDNLKKIKEFTDTPGQGVTRFSFGEHDAAAREYIIKRAVKAGCSVRIDAVQNVYITLNTGKKYDKTVVAGSHIDTVRNGGWLDGIYGVCGALEVMETLAEELSKGGELNSDIQNNYQVVIFAEEEGSVFGSTMTGSKFVSGIYEDGDMDKLKDDEGKTMRERLMQLKSLDDAMSVSVYNTSENSAKDLVWDFSRIRSVLELHIEQGPVLERENISIGIVDIIFGMRLIEIEIKGIGNHAGATPMTERYDAMCAAAECILAAEKLVKADPDRRAVVTVGKVRVNPNCSNVIPESVVFSLEVRDNNIESINGFTDKIIAELKSISDKRGVGIAIREHSKSSPLHLSQELVEEIAIEAQGESLSFKKMNSGAVHDACMLAKHIDTGMIFVPSIGGRSHVPQENTHEKDLIDGAQLLLNIVLKELKKTT